MIEIQLNNRVIEVQKELTIGQYQKFIKNQEVYKTDKSQLLALYLNCSLYELMDLPIKDVKFVEEYLTTQLLPNELKDETHTKFTHKGVLYGLENDFSKMTWGAWVDLEVFSADEITENINKIMAVLYRPIIKETKKSYIIAPYKASEIDDRAELFKELPISYWFGASSFFLLISSIYTSNTLRSLDTMNRANQLIMKGWTILPKWIKRRLPLDSILLSPSNSQMKTLQNLSK
jgi:hypothetical protein